MRLVGSACRNRHHRKIAAATERARDDRGDRFVFAETRTHVPKRGMETLSVPMYSAMGLCYFTIATVSLVVLSNILPEAR
jgi:hypothetical protein